MVNGCMKAFRREKFNSQAGLTGWGGGGGDGGDGGSDLPEGGRDNYKHPGGLSLTTAGSMQAR